MRRIRRCRRDAMALKPRQPSIVSDGDESELLVGGLGFGEALVVECDESALAWEK